MKEAQKSTIRVHRITTDVPFLTEAREIQRQVEQRAAEISHEEDSFGARHLDHWLRAEAELLQPVPLAVWETERELFVRAKVPGFRENDLDLWVDSQQLYITGTAAELGGEEQGTPLYSEWTSNKILREFQLPVEIDPESAEAHLRRGVLELVLLKTK